MKDTTTIDDTSDNGDPRPPPALLSPHQRNYASPKWYVVRETPYGNDEVQD